MSDQESAKGSDDPDNQNALQNLFKLDKRPSEEKFRLLSQISNMPIGKLRAVSKLSELPLSVLRSQSTLTAEQMSQFQNIAYLAKQNFERLRGYIWAEEAEVIDPAIKNTIRKIEGFTVTSRQRIQALCESIRYIDKYKIPGAIVECGVWRGGSMMATAYSLLDLGITDRDLYLFDTFSGMTEPTDVDKERHSQKTADELLGDRSSDESYMVHATLEEVKSNMDSTGYPQERIHYIEGKVEDTIPDFPIGDIALLRLDTDWYESTKVELEYFYPRLATKGVLIIDDYGHFEGAQLAVDEYFAKCDSPIFLHRIDYTGRLVIKPS